MTIHVGMLLNPTNILFLKVSFKLQTFTFEQLQGDALHGGSVFYGTTPVWFQAFIVWHNGSMGKRVVSTHIST